ncbi:phosphonate metabolism transcriptional regulator PhnF [Escherichia coli]|nr:phosphonate metabolism transcriptional regulator PhnF [Escherichia coli]
MRVNHQHETNNLASNSGLFGCALSAQNCAPISPEKNAKLHLRRVNGVALCLIDHYFADLTLWPTLQRFDSGSLHDFLREQTGIALRRSQTRISARRAQAKECQRLEIPNMSPLLCVRTLNHRDGESSPAEYSVSLTRADMIEFTMEH